MDEARIAAKALHDFRREHYREGPCWEDIDWGHQERWVLSMKAALEAIASQPVPAPDLVERVAEDLRASLLDILEDMAVAVVDGFKRNSEQALDDALVGASNKIIELVSTAIRERNRG